jgi:autophagy-related protein 9
MASNILSRLLPSASEEGPQPGRHPSTNDYDAEAGNAMAIDEENLEGNFEEQDLEQLLAEATASEAGTEATNFVTPEKEARKPARTTSKRRPKWMTDSPGAAVNDDDNDVPESLLLEGKKESPAPRRYSHRRMSSDARDDTIPSVPGPNTPAVRNQWETTRAQQPLYDNGPRRHAPPVARAPGAGLLTADPKQRALWKWANVQNLDNFLGSVYFYYEEHGVWSICLKRSISLL